MKKHLHAISVDERIPVLDALRGFALIGIFLANLVSFFGYYYLSFDQVHELSLSDRSVLFAIDWLVEGKFYALFSMLFGFGFALQQQRALDSGVSFLPYWYRRMAVLLGIGLLHMYCIWYGDILTLYALLGLVLPLFMLNSNRQILVAVVVLLVAPLIIHALVVMTADAAFWNSSARYVATLKSGWGLADKTTLELVLSDEPRDVWLANIMGALQRPMSYLRSGRIPQVLGFFLLGVLLARKLVPLWREKKTIPTAWWLACLQVGLFGSAIYAWIKAVTTSPYTADAIGLLQGLVYHVGCVTLMLGYAGLMAWCWQRGKFSPVLNRLTILGRMPLTSYITQTSLGVVLFYGYGFGLLGDLQFALIPVLVLLIILLQCAFATFWLNVFAQGPLEMLWRKFSYR